MARAALFPGSIDPVEAKLLQRTIGNKAVGRLGEGKGSRQMVEPGGEVIDPRPSLQAILDQSTAVAHRTRNGGKLQSKGEPTLDPIRQQTGLGSRQGLLVQRKRAQDTRRFFLATEDTTAFTPLGSKEVIWVTDYDGVFVNVIDPSAYDQASDDDPVKVEMEIKGKKLKGHIDKKEYIRFVAYSAPESELETVESESEEPTPDEHELTIAVARQDPRYLEYQKHQLKLTMKKRLLGWLWKRHRLSRADIKKQSARQAVLARSQKIVEEDVEIESEELAKKNAIEICGHTWIKLHKKSGNTLEKWSFGFWPAQRPKKPQESVDGIVHSPDTRHESEPGEDRLDLKNSISKKQYGKALALAKKRHKSPPSYKLIGYNCTKFAREISNSAGVSFPGSAWTVPFVGKMYSPNAVYEAVEKIKKSTSQKEESTPETIPVEEEQEEIVTPEILEEELDEEEPEEEEDLYDDEETFLDEEGEQELGESGALWARDEENYDDLQITDPNQIKSWEPDTEDFCYIYLAEDNRKLLVQTKELEAFLGQELFLELKAG